MYIEAYVERVGNLLNGSHYLEGLVSTVVRGG